MRKLRKFLSTSALGLHQKRTECTEPLCALTAGRCERQNSFALTSTFKEHVRAT